MYIDNCQRRRIARLRQETRKQRIHAREATLWEGRRRAEGGAAVEENANFTMR